MRLYVILSRQGGSDAVGTADRPQDAGVLRSILADHGLEPSPLHPNSTDPELASQYFVDVPDDRLATDLRQRLLESGAAEAAYTKPNDSAPSS